MRVASSRPIWSIFARSGCDGSALPPCPSVGVSTASSAPAPIASYTYDAFAPTFAVTIRIAHGERSMMLRVADTPSMRGITRSIRTRSGGCATQKSTACAPSVATHSTRCSGRSAIVRRSASTASGKSLTMPMFMACYASPIRSCTASSNASSWKPPFAR